MQDTHATHLQVDGRKEGLKEGRKGGKVGRGEGRTAFFASVTQDDYKGSGRIRIRTACST